MVVLHYIAEVSSNFFFFLNFYSKLSSKLVLPYFNKDTKHKFLIESVSRWDYVYWVGLMYIYNFKESLINLKWSLTILK